MLIQYILLYLFIKKYLKKKKYNWLFLNKTEQDQIRYLIGILILFTVYTQLISHSLLLIIQFIFPIYNKLFMHLKDIYKKFSSKRILQKQAIKIGLVLAENKIKKYYGKTKGTFSNLYGYTILLTPYLKKKFKIGD